MKVKTTLKICKYLAYAQLLLFAILPLSAQPVGGTGRMVVPGTHFKLTESDGNFTATNGATWVPGQGWLFASVDKTIRTPSFNLESLKFANLRWYARVYTATNSTYVTYVDYYDNIRDAAPFLPNTHYSVAGSIATHTGIFKTTQSLTDVSVEISQNWYPLNEPEPDLPVNLYITEFWIEADEPQLPVSLARFNASKQEGNVMLSWATSNEVNNEKFEIERSFNGKNWDKIGSVNAQSAMTGSNFEIRYNYTDESPLEGHNLYRLKQIDYDGSYQYSTARQVSFEQTSRIVVYPNPSTDYLIVEGLKSNEEIRIVNINGQIVKALEAGRNKSTINLDGLRQGAYFVKVVNRNSTVVQKLIVKN
jgi:hypothetical protein